MGKTTWVNKAASSQLVTFESQADGTRVLSSATDNETDLERFVDLELRSIFTTNPAVGAQWRIWFLVSLDGTNYEDGSSSLEPARAPDLIIPVRPVQTQQVVSIVNHLLPSLKFKVLAINETGATTTSTAADNEINTRRHSETTA